MTDTEKALDELALLLARGGAGGARVRGEGLLMIGGVNATVTYKPPGPRRITGVKFRGTNCVLSHDGLDFNTINTAAGGFVSHVIAWKDNDAAEMNDMWTNLNIVIVPPNQIFFNNRGAGLAYVTLFWDILDGIEF